jgi:hypothetical protein
VATIFGVGVVNQTRSKHSIHRFDSLLLAALLVCEDERVAAERTVWREAQKKRWSKFASEDYEQVIQAFRRVLARKPLWLIEEYWRGFQ